MQQLRRLSHVPEGVPVGSENERARAACGRLLYRVSDGNVTWWVQSASWSSAGRLVRRHMCELGCSKEEIAHYFRANMSVTAQTWAQAANTQLGDSLEGASVLSLFVGGRDEVLACSEW